VARALARARGARAMRARGARAAHLSFCATPISAPDQSEFQSSEIEILI